MPDAVAAENITLRRRRERSGAFPPASTREPEQAYKVYSLDEKYFRPTRASGIGEVEFICRNERQFYTSDLPADTLLFEGTGVLTTLPEAQRPIPDQRRINPVFFSDAPDIWLATRPEPKELYRHFHSCHTERGAVRTGYWLRHQAKAEFTYDMGGRVGQTSPLYHKVKAGEDGAFPAIIEFDHGPQSSE